MNQRLLSRFILFICLIISSSLVNVSCETPASMYIIVDVQDQSNYKKNDMTLKIRRAKKLIKEIANEFNFKRITYLNTKKRVVFRKNPKNETEITIAIEDVYKENNKYMIIYLLGGFSTGKQYEKIRKRLKHVFKRKFDEGFYKIKEDYGNPLKK